jgi:hypothetical protein
LVEVSDAFDPGAGCRLRREIARLRPVGDLRSHLFFIWDKAPDASQRQFGADPFGQSVVYLQERVDYLCSTPQTDTEKKFIATLVDRLLETSPADQKTVIRMGVLDSSNQRLEGWLIHNDLPEFT